MPHNEKATEFLKECMADALLQLLKEKPIEKISAQEIATLAGVGRATFFRNFRSKTEMLTYKLVCLWNKWATEKGLAEHRRFTIRNVSDFFNFNYTIKHIYSIIYSAKLQYVIYDAYYQIMMSQAQGDERDCYRVKFYSYGLFGLLDEWIKRDYKETPKEMVQLFGRVMIGNL
ncbi:MAG: TetR/AcrR family transcriptional regulator [Clostridia bacterium]|nr:TetR/AcrR family transcriptional regulator [Clostridia bacterium]